MPQASCKAPQRLRPLPAFMYLIPAVLTWFVTAPVQITRETCNIYHLSFAYLGQSQINHTFQIEPTISPSPSPPNTKAVIMADRYSVTRPHEMILRNSIRTKTSWIFLPAEIRLMILEIITYQKYPGWASLASVCKEWQLFIEKRNFHRLKLQVRCLDDFESIIIRQRELVHHIWLNIELPKYTCRCCNKQESISRASHNSSIIGNGITKLFSILSTWKPTNGLTLELNAYSPSDSDHWFKDYYFASNDEGNEDATSVQEIGSKHDVRHGWVDGQQVKMPSNPAILRLFHYINPLFREELPRVDTVTCFIIRRQLRRWFFPITLRFILDKLCRLEHIIYEPWQAWERIWGIMIDKGACPYRFSIPPLQIPTPYVQPLTSGF